jgi:hypothetical protein
MKTPFVLLLFLPLTAVAGLRDSGDFSLTTESGAPGHPRCSSARFTSDMASDGMAGISQTSGAAGQPVFTAKFGYAAQLYDAAGLSLVAAPNPAPESASAQLTAAASADDGTGLSLAGAATGWQILSGPVTAINTSGRASTAAVRRNEQATVRATVAGQTVNGSFIVADTLTDNFGPVAGDGFADRWQFRYFDANGDGTLENPALAAPGADPDSDGLDNFTEAAFALSPLRFSASPLIVGGNPADGSLLLRWTRPVDTLGIIAEPQWSDVPSLWHASGTGPPGGQARTFTTLLLGTEQGEDGAPVQLWQATLSPADDAKRLFVRLSAR